MRILKGLLNWRGPMTQGLREQAEVSSRPRTTDALSALSHELRTPINGIVGYAELLLSPSADTESPATRREHARHILASGKQLQSMIDNVLDAMRVQQGTLSFTEQDFDCPEVLEVCVRTASDLAEQTDVRLNARLMDGVAVYGDPRRLKQAVSALISNAIKFSPKGGFVYVEMKRSASDDLYISVSDGGIGMPEEDRTRAFETFVQLDAGENRRFGGIGVGLALARHISRWHGGDVSLESAEAAGTIARIKLPASRVHWPSAKTKGAPEDMPKTKVA